MALIETWFNQDLKEPVKVRYLDGNVFSADNAGNLIGVNIFSNGEPATLGGSVAANVIRADGATVAVVGALSDNKATVVLNQSCYAVPGPISIIIKITQSGAVTTVCAVVANVYQSSTDTVVDPGTIIPSIETLLAAIEAAVASIPADYSSLWTSLAPAYSNSSTYIIGQYVTYDGKLYRCVSTIDSPESFTIAHWSQVSIGGDLLRLWNDNIHVYDGVVGAYTNVAGNVWKNYPFRRFHRYCIQRTSGSGAIVPKTTNGQTTTAVDIWKTMQGSQLGIYDDAVYMMTATNDADTLYVYADGPAAWKVWDADDLTILKEETDQIKVATGQVVTAEPNNVNMMRDEYKISNYAYLYNTGIGAENANYNAYVRMPCLPDTEYYIVPQDQCHVLYYDDNGQIISGELLSVSGVSEYTKNCIIKTPSNCHYVTVSTYKTINAEMGTVDAYINDSESPVVTFKPSEAYMEDIINLPKMFRKVSNANLHSGQRLYSGKYPSYQNGTLQTNANTSFSVIRVKGNTKYTYGGFGGCHFAWFNSSGTYLDGFVSASPAVVETVTSPANAYYLAYMVWNDQTSGLFIVEGGYGEYSDFGTGSVYRCNYEDPFDVALNPVNLLLLGDSITAGAGASGLSGTETFTTSLGTKTIYTSGNSWAVKLTTYLASAFPNITVTNHGWGGINWAQLARYINEFVPAGTTHCIIGCGINSEGSKTFDPYITTIVNYLHNLGIKVYAWGGWLGTHPNQSNINTAARVQAANIHGFRINGVECVPTYSKALKYIEENNIPFSDVMEYQPDDEIVHPNDLGHEILYRIIRESFGF